MLLRSALLALAIALGPATPANAFPMPRDYAVVRAACPYLPTPNSCLFGRVIYWQPGSGHWTLLHELGHRYDAERLTFAHRAWLTVLLRFPAGTPWWTAYGGPELDHNSPGEMFASIYASCAMRNVTRRYKPVCATVRLIR